MKTPAILLSASLFLAAASTTVAQPANDHFSGATLMTSYLVTGSNVGATQQVNDPTSVAIQGGGRSPTGGRSVWWKWVAPESRRYTFKTGDRSGMEPSSNFDTQLGVYTGTTLASLVEVASNEDNVLYSSGLSSVEVDVVSGQTYYIMVDGFGGQTGTIHLYAIPTRYTLTVAANPPGAGSVSFDPTFESDGYLAGTVVTLTATSNSSTNFYGWSGDAGGRSNVVNIVMNGNKSIVANFFNEPEVILNDPQLIWQNRAGPVAAWFLSGTNYTGALSFGPLADSWRLGAIADFDGNGYSDFLFQNKDGRLAAWLMDENVRTNGVLLPNSPATQRLIGAGDFNYNVQPDLLFQRPDGQLRVWIMDSAHNRQAIVPLQHVNPAWRAVVVTDFDKNGSADIFFQNPVTGHVALWLMNGVNREAVILMDPTSWRLAAVRDLNNDGHPDLIFQRDGKTAVWMMNGTNRTSVAYLREGLALADTWNLVGAR